jgi:hypothetical protein
MVSSGDMAFGSLGPQRHLSTIRTCWSCGDGIVPARLRPRGPGGLIEVAQLWVVGRTPDITPPLLVVATAVVLESLRQDAGSRSLGVNPAL